MINPWMSREEIEHIISTLDIQDTMLEYGSGGSTLLFSKYVTEYYSVEHVEEWHKKVTLELGKKPNVYYYHVPWDKPRTIPTKYEEFKTYIEKPAKFNLKFNKVFIDGRARQYCAKFILPYLQEDALVFIHDFFKRPQYHGVLEWYDIVHKIEHTEQTLVTLKKK